MFNSLSRKIEIEFMPDPRNSFLAGIVPSTYDLCHQFEHNAVTLSLKNISGIDLSQYQVQIIFRSENEDLGYVTLPDNTYDFLVSRYYTSKRNLEAQYIFREKETGNIAIRTNIIKFNVWRSIPPAVPKDQLTALLLDLINSGDIVLSIEDGYLILKDKDGNEIGRYPVSEEDTEAAEKENTTDIIIQVTETSAVILNSPKLITNSKNIHKVIFRIDASWDSVPVRKAFMYQPFMTRDNPSEILLDDGNSAVIPKECLAVDDYLYVTLYGYDHSGYLRKTCNFVYAYVYKGAWENKKTFR